MKKFIRGEKISQIYAQDGRRDIYDYRNAQLVNSRKKVDCVFIGDSITEFWELPLYFGDLGYIVNRGIAGDVIYGVSSRFDTDVVQIKPRLCVIMIGVNDVDKIDTLANKMVVQKGNYEALIPYIKTTFVNKMFSMYKKILLKAKKKKIKMIVCSVTPHNHNLDAGIDYRNTYILGLNEKLKELAKELEFDYVDYNSIVRDENGLFSLEYSWDRLHPNVDGYNLMAEILKPYLIKNLKR